MPALSTGRRDAARGLGLLATALLLGGSAAKRRSGGSEAAGSTSCTSPHQWLTLPPTPVLPKPATEGSVRSAGASLHYATYDSATSSSGGDGPHPFLLLHGGMANSNYWGGVLPDLAARRRIILMDTRGHGRSTLGPAELGFELFASDALAVLDHLAIPKVSIVGWSDGAITGLQLGTTRPDRIAGLFVFGANFDRGGVVPAGDRTPVFQEFERRCATEYRSISPDPEGFERLREALHVMWLREPHFRKGQLAQIAAPTTIADGEYDEIIARGHVRELAAAIPSAKLVIQRCVGHFALLQDPAGFARQVVEAGLP